MVVRNVHTGNTIQYTQYSNTKRCTHTCSRCMITSTKDKENTCRIKSIANAFEPPSAAPTPELEPSVSFVADITYRIAGKFGEH